MTAIYRVDPSDDVATALRDLTAGETIDGVTAAVDIPRGHKVAVNAVAVGTAVRKFGFPFGVATRAIAAGDHVHTHNVATQLGSAAAQGNSATDEASGPARSETFHGYRRADGRVGTRNEIWILCTVGCVANTARRIADRASARFAGQVDGVYAFPHPFGCSQLGDDLAGTRKLLASLAAHPNAGGVLIVGLGCESNQIDALLGATHVADPARLRAFTAQSVEDEVEAGVAAVAELVAVAAHDRRSACPLSDLVLGLKCGGSDGFSGITANPLVGRAADAVVASGGSAVLTEIPEIFGAEHLLRGRADRPEVAQAIDALVDRFKQYFTDHGEPVSENPSPGNIAGGITTLEEKSLGAVQKAGHGAVVDVIDYGARVQARGVTLLEAPGNDAVSSTALAASGATLILFTTGRGTPMGFPVPTIKIASNTALAERKPGWIDFDAGPLLAGETMAAMTDRLMARIVRVASGEAVCAEINGEREIAIWKRGVTL